MEKITIREIAKRSGVSIATVSRAVNPHTSRLVKKTTRKRILDVVKKTGYLPSPVAKRLATGKSTNIVLFVGTRYKSIFYNDYYMKLLSGVMQVIEETHYTLTIRMMKLREADFDLSRVIRGMDTAGCIICDLPGVLQVSMTGLENVKIPVVILNKMARKNGVSFMGCDNFKAAYDAVSHLIALGHTRIAIVKGTYFEKDSIDRFEGYKKSLVDHNIPINDSYVYEGDFSEETGIKAIKEFMTMTERPTAVFAANDEIALGAFMKLNELGLKCPRDVSIIGFDGIDAGRYLVPKLSTMRQPIYEMAQDATRQIVLAMEKNIALGGLKIYDANLIKGGTCDRPPFIMADQEMNAGKA